MWRGGGPDYLHDFIGLSFPAGINVDGAKVADLRPLVSSHHRSLITTSVRSSSWGTSPRK
jgi:hypothetical protein